MAGVHEVCSSEDNEDSEGSVDYKTTSDSDSSDTESSDEVKSDGSITPLVRRAVRRSLKKVQFASDEDEEGKNKDDSSGSNPQEDSDTDSDDMSGVKRQPGHVRHCIRSSNSDYRSSSAAEDKVEQNLPKSQLQEMDHQLPKSRKVLRRKKHNEKKNLPNVLEPGSASPVDGPKTLETWHRQEVLIHRRIKDLERSLRNRPTEDQLVEDPPGLKTTLMVHQKYAVRWLLWRESQNLAGGVLADDQGLGKTLTIISLVVMANHIMRDAVDDGSGPSSSGNEQCRGGTLIVVPASLIGQWEKEISDRCTEDLLTVEIYHGANREMRPKRLARNKIVLTTYSVLSRALKNACPLFKIHWERAILDEAHVIRNHQSQTCKAVCRLSASKRWVLTGTPVHNKEMDLFSLFKFLKCSPFDDVRVWKRWIGDKNFAGSERLGIVMKCIMLRRTKQELQAEGQLGALPVKTIETIEVKLDPDERMIYDKVMVFSRSLFAQYLAQRAEKTHMAELGAGSSDQPSCQRSHRGTKFTKAQKKLVSTHADVGPHQILVLILRLRQLCCHPSLIHSMLDTENLDVNGLEGVEDPVGLVTRLRSMSLGECSGGDTREIGDDERIFENLLTSANPVFDANHQSSKIKAVLEKIEEIVQNNDDKVIVVSQWTSVLEIIASEIERMDDVSYRMFSGKIAVKGRQSVLDDFNSPNSRTNVLLLSLTAGGVGVNLVGANHLILVEGHWNPQLESQAQDRIYRLGQKKNVWIYKYICSDTIEERIEALQKKKLQIANRLLSCSGKAAPKLSLNEMRSILGL